MSKTFPFFVHITDLHLRADTEAGWNALEGFVEQVCEMSPRPAFVVCTGDIVFASMKIESEPEDVQPDFERYRKIMAKLPVPLYNVVGNHDMTRSAGAAGTGGYGKELFVEYCGTRFGSFDWNDWHGVILDQWIIQPSQPALEYGFDDEQLRWLRDDLAGCAPGKNVLVFVHHRIPDDPNAWNKLSEVLRDDLNYFEVAGCDHQNSLWSRDNWRSYTTGSFCGGWWDGACIDTNAAGYALMVPDESGGLKQYYRATDQAIAIASPIQGQVVEDVFTVDAIDPQTGQFARYEIDSSSWAAGWNEAEVRVADKCQTVHLFRQPDSPTPISCRDGVFFEFDLVEPVSSPLEIECNGISIGRLSPGSSMDGALSFEIPAGHVCDWNRIVLAGSAVIRSPRMVTGGQTICDPRASRLQSARPQWFGDGLLLTWDTSCELPPTPWRRPENTFFFHLEEID